MAEDIPQSHRYTSPDTLNPPDVLLLDLSQTLLRRGLVDYKDVELAAHYQKKMAAKGYTKTFKDTLLELEFIDRETLDQVMAEEEQAREKQLSEPTERIEQLIQLRTQLLEKQLAFAKAADEIAQLAATSSSLYEMFHRTTSQIVDRFRAD